MESASEYTAFWARYHNGPMGVISIPRPTRKQEEVKKVQASLQAEDTKLSSSSCVRNETAEGHPQVGHSKQGSVLGQSNRKKTAPKVSSSTKQPNNSFDLSSNSSEEQQSLIRMAFPDAEFEDVVLINAFTL